MELCHDVDDRRRRHLEEARRVLALPIDASRLHWHPFGVYAIPLAKRRDAQRSWSRRLHVWHPDAQPVGPHSPYGVHTHTGPAASNLLVGALVHHLYQFDADPDGDWLCTPLGGDPGKATLRGHTQATTPVGQRHTFPAHQPHGVGKTGAFAVSLFEQMDTTVTAPFTTWRDLGGPEEALERTGPIGLEQVRLEALGRIEEAVYQAPLGAAR